MKLGLITFEATIEEVEADRSSFVDSFKDVVVAQFAAAGVTVAAEDVIVTDISPGSVVVSYTVTVPCGTDCDSADTAAETANTAMLAAADSRSLAVGTFETLRGGTQPQTMATTTPTPSSPPPPPPPDEEDGGSSMVVVVIVLVVLAGAAAGAYVVVMKRGSDEEGTHKKMESEYADGPSPTGGGGGSRNPSFGRAMDTPPPAVRPRGLSIAATTPGAAARVDEAVRTAFETYDVDGSGTLTKDEAKNMVVAMNLEVSAQYVDGVWSAFDTDGNGTLDMEEFARFFEVLVKRDNATRQ